MSGKQCSKNRTKDPASSFCIHTEQAFVAGIFLSVKCPWKQVFQISIKVLSLCSFALSTTIITMAPKSIIMPTPSITPVLMQTLRCAHATLSWTLVSSPQLPRSQSESSVWHHYESMGLAVWHWASLWEALMKNPRGEVAQQGCC